MYIINIRNLELLCLFILQIQCDSTLNIPVLQIKIDRPPLKSPFHLWSLALRHCHRNISTEAKVLIHDLALTFYRDSPPQPAVHHS